MEALEEAVMNDDWCVEAHFNLALLYGKQNKIAKALEHFEKAMLISSLLPRLGDLPPDADASCLIGRLFQWKDE